MTPESAGEPGSALLLTCEHAGREVPERWAHRFRGLEHLLDSHRGQDPGAVAVARAMAGLLEAPLLLHRVTRLLADVNRSESHPRVLGEPVRRLPGPEREAILAEHHRPHRRAVEAEVGRLLGEHGGAVHVGIHTFTPVLDGRPRTTGIGLLYDPGRAGERGLAGLWAESLREALTEITVHRNRPYRGISDGLTTTLRGRLGEERYRGLELEVRSDLVAGDPDEARRMGEILARTLQAALGRTAPA